jgi:hypothetical protein
MTRHEALEILGYRCDTHGSPPEITRWLDARPMPALPDGATDWDAIIAAAEDLVGHRKTWPNSAAFLGEFSMPELAAIELSADPTIAALRLVLAAWTADVWSDDERIQLGMAALVDAEIIDQERADEILAP